VPVIFCLLYVILPDVLGYYLLMVLTVGAFTKIRAVFAYGWVTFEFTVAFFIGGCVS